MVMLYLQYQNMADARIENLIQVIRQDVALSSAFKIIVKLLIIGSMALGALGFNSPSFAQSVEENKLKAVYLVNFARFTVWPEGDDATNIKLCIYKESSIFQYIKQLNGFKIDEVRKIQVIENPLHTDKCNMIYWDEPSIIYRSYHQAKQVLEVTDSDVIFEDGLDVLIYPKDAKLRFYVSKSTTANSKFKLSSKLLRLSKLPNRLLNQLFESISAYV